MAISRFDKPAGLPPVDFDFLFKTKEYHDKANKEAEDDASALSTKLSSIKALPQDKAVRNQKLNAYDTRMNDWYKKYQNNMSAGLGELRTIKNDFNKDVTRGQLGAIQANYDARAAHEKQVDDAFEKGHINQQRRDALLNYDLMKYKGVGEENPDGQYNSYSGSTPAEEVSPTKIVDDYLTGWKATKVTQGGYSMDKQGRLFKDSFINNKHVREYVTDKELRDAVTPVLMNDPKVNSFVDQETKFATANIDPNAAYQITDAQGKPMQVTGKQMIDNYKNSMYSRAIDFGVAKHGYMQQEDTQSDLTFLPEHLSGESDANGNMYLTNNLNSIKVPATNTMKVNTSTLGDKGWEGTYSGGTSGAGWAPWRTLSATPAKPEDIKFTPEQETIYKNSGKTAKNNVEKGKIINEAIDNFNSNLIFPGIMIYDYAYKPVAERAERENKMFFDKAGPLVASTRNFKTMSGDVENPTGKEFYENFGDDKKYTKTVTAKLQPDNPYYVAGRMVTVKDNSSGEIVGTYAMSGSDQEMNDPKSKVIHSMAQARYTPTGSVTIPMITENEKGERVSKNYVINFQRDNDTKVEKASVVDPENGNIVSEITNDGSMPVGTFNALYESLYK